MPITSSSISSSDPRRRPGAGSRVLLVAAAAAALAALVGLRLSRSIPTTPAARACSPSAGVRQQGPRTAAASRGRDPAFNAAIVGNSHIQLLSPGAAQRSRPASPSSSSPSRPPGRRSSSSSSTGSCATGRPAARARARRSTDAGARPTRTLPNHEAVPVLALQREPARLCPRACALSTSSRSCRAGSPTCLGAERRAGAPGRLLGLRGRLSRPRLRRRSGAAAAARGAWPRRRRQPDRPLPGRDGCARGRRAAAPTSPWCWSSRRATSPLQPGPAPRGGRGGGLQGALPGARRGAAAHVRGRLADRPAG